MKKIFPVYALLLTLASFSVKAQATSTKGSAGNMTNSANVGSTTTNGPGAIGNDRTNQATSGKAGTKSASPVVNSTVDGSNGSATNDGASGQSGTPAPLPAATNQGASKSTSGQPPKTGTRKMSRTKSS